MRGVPDDRDTDIFAKLFGEMTPDILHRMIEHSADIRIREFRFQTDVNTPLMQYHPSQFVGAKTIDAIAGAIVDGIPS